MSAKLRSIINFGKVIKWKNLVIAQILFINLVADLINVPRANAASCVDVEFIFARPSGDVVNDDDYLEWRKVITEQLQNTQLTYNFFELGSDPDSPYQYPAVTIAGINLITTYIGAGEAFAFGRSVRAGREELVHRVEKVSAACENTKFVLGGYSQGAMVITTTLPRLNADKIIYVTNFGDPKLFLPEGAGANGRPPKVPDACKGKNLSEYRTHVPDCWAYQGVLNGQQPYRPDTEDDSTKNFIGKVGTWCNGHDIFCSSGINIPDHANYLSSGSYADGARKIYQKLKAAFPEKVPSQTAKSMHDVLFLIDSTGSMKDLWKAYRDELRSLGSQVFQTGGRAAAYGYKDSLYRRSSFKFCDFSCDEEKFISSTTSYVAMDGGDVDESLLSAAYLSMGELDWQWGATKSIVVVTDAGYHEKDYQDVDLPMVVERSLSIDPVNIYVIGPESLADTYKELTTQTNGKFFGLKSLNEENSAINQAIMQEMATQILERPVAQLSASEYSGLVGDTLYFDASESYSLNSSELSYEWDLDGDGVFELKTDTATAEKTYTDVFDGYIQVRVSDDANSSTMSAHVSIQRSLAAPAEIDDLTYAQVNDQDYDFTVTTSAPNVLLSINDAVLGFVKLDDDTEVTIFPIKDITRNATVLLTPYSETGQRGISRSVTIEAGSGDEDDDLEIRPTPPVTNSPEKDLSTTDNGVAGNQTSATPSAPNLSSPTSVSTKPIDIPKAPDTGVYDRRLARKKGLA